jgi:hypothetical protein
MTGDEATLCTLQGTTDANGSGGYAPELDEEKFRVHLASLSLTREQESALLRTLWQIMRTFVDLGFGQDPVHLIFDEAAKGASGARRSSVQEEIMTIETAEDSTAKANNNKMKKE